MKVVRIEKQQPVYDKIILITNYFSGLTAPYFTPRRSRPRCGTCAKRV